MFFRFLLDENVPRSVLRELNARGYTVEYVPRGVDDKTVVRIAKEKKAILVTRDSDFADELQYPPGSHPGIIVLRIHPALPGLTAERLIETLNRLGKDIEGKLVIIYNDNVEIIG